MAGDHRGLHAGACAGAHAAPAPVLPSRLTGDLLRRLAPLLQGRACALLDWPDHPNVGDHLIWLGEKLALTQHLGCTILHESAWDKADLKTLAALPAEAALVLHGGGNFGDLYPVHQKFRETIVDGFPDRLLIMMPQSVQFRDPARLDQCLELYAGHGQLHIFLRDQASLELIRSRTADSRYELGIDAAFFLADLMPALQERLGTSAAFDVVQLLRQDDEMHASRPEARADGPAYDWLRRDGIPDPDFARHAEESLIALGLADVFSSRLDRQSWEHLHYGLSIIRQGRRLVTDRLHGHILALLMGKPHTVFDTNNGKIGNFCRTWTAGSPLVQIASLPS